MHLTVYFYSVADRVVVCTHNFISGEEGGGGGVVFLVLFRVFVVEKDVNSKK